MQARENGRGGGSGKSGRYRLLFVISSMNVGGPQRSLVGLLQRLDFAQFEVHVAVLDGLDGPLADWLPSEVEIVQVPTEVSAATHARGRVSRNFRLLASRLPVASMIRLLTVLARGVFSLGGRQVMRQRAWVAVRDKLPPISGAYDAAFGILGLSTMAVVDLVDARFKYHWIRSDTRVLKRNVQIDGSYFDQLTGAVSVSESCARIFEAMYPTFDQRIVVYKNDIPTLKSSAQSIPITVPDAATVLVTVSRLDPLKGIDIAIEACAQLVRDGRRVHWIVVGEGSERRRLEDMIREHGLEQQFVLWGQSHHIPAFLDVADIYVHPSRTEGRSNSVEEARASGLPIVATAYDTVEDQVRNGETGIVCAISPDGVANAVAALIDDTQHAQLLGRNASNAYAVEVDDPNSVLAMLATGALNDAVRGGS